MLLLLQKNSLVVLHATLPVVVSATKSIHKAITLNQTLITKHTVQPNWS